VRHVAHEAAHEFLHLDGKIVQTLKLLVTRPGELTLEYFRGRRARYVSPLRLYLTVSLVYFALVAIAPAPNAKFEVTAEDIRTPEQREAIERVQERMREFRSEFPHQVPRVLFVLMPLFALTTWTFYGTRQPYYIPHLYYSIHFHTFVFLVLAVGKLFAFGGRAGDAIGTVLTLVIFPYHYVALRRAFGGTRAEVGWKGTATLLLYLLAVAGVFIVLLKVWLTWVTGTDLHPS
jgi:hypothetical protein